MDQWRGGKVNPHVRERHKLVCAPVICKMFAPCHFAWSESVCGVQRKCVHLVLSASRYLRLFSILHRVGALKTTMALPSASVAQLPKASAANSRTSESSEQERMCTSFFAAWQVTSARRPKVHVDSEQRQNIANLSRSNVLPVLEGLPTDPAMPKPEVPTATEDSSRWRETSRTMPSTESANQPHETPYHRLTIYCCTLVGLIWYAHKLQNVLRNGGLHACHAKLSRRVPESKESALAMESRHPNSNKALHTVVSDTARTMSSRSLSTCPKEPYCITKSMHEISNQGTRACLKFSPTYLVYQAAEKQKQCD